MDLISQTKAEYRSEQWSKRIQERQASGMSVNAWCQARGLNPKTYYYWLRKLRLSALEEQCQQIVPVALSSASSIKKKLITLQGDGISIQIDNTVSPQAIQALVSALLLPC